MPAAVPVWRPLEQPPVNSSDSQAANNGPGGGNTARTHGLDLGGMGFRPYHFTAAIPDFVGCTPRCGLSEWRCRWSEGDPERMLPMPDGHLA